MKRLFYLIGLMATMTIVSCSSSDSVSTGDFKSSGCQRITRSDDDVRPKPHLKMTREGKNIYCELSNYDILCYVNDVSIHCEQENSTITMIIVDNKPIKKGQLTTCICPTNFSYTIYNANGDEFNIMLVDLAYTNPYTYNLGRVSFRESNVVDINIATNEITYPNKQDEEAYELTTFVE